MRTVTIFKHVSVNVCASTTGAGVPPAMCVCAQIKNRVCLCVLVPVCVLYTCVCMCSVCKRACVWERVAERPRCSSTTAWFYVGHNAPSLSLDVMSIHTYLTLPNAAPSLTGNRALAPAPEADRALRRLHWDQFSLPFQTTGALLAENAGADQRPVRRRIPRFPSAPRP